MRSGVLKCFFQVIEWLFVKLGSLIKGLSDVVGGQPIRFGSHAVSIWFRSGDQVIVALNELYWVSDHAVAKSRSLSDSRVVTARG